jgi:hypothetical protein
VSYEEPLTEGFCFVCGTPIDGDLVEHFEVEHPGPSIKAKTPILPWRKRLENVTKAIEDILQESDTNVQIQKMDEDVIKELYLVRARLTQTKRTPALQAEE